MITAPDFAKKQVVFVLFNEGEKMSFSNDNLVIKDSEGKVKMQCTCYRLFIVYVIGHCSITTALIQKAKKFGFFIALMTPGFRLYAIIGAEKDGNTLLKQQQYRYDSLDLAKHITKNKINNQISVLKEVRNKNDAIKEAIETIDSYLEKIDTAEDNHQIMAFEGLSSKLYFRNHFNNVRWRGRQPRLKRDMVNSLLDIGYTLLFTFVDSILLSYGFDTYRGVLHTQFYMRKSLTCDLVEPFRVIVDKQVKKSINLKQAKEDDFIIFNNQYKLKWEKNHEYIKFLMTPLLENKDKVFLYIQSYYRSFMKNDTIEKYPIYDICES